MILELHYFTGFKIKYLMRSIIHKIFTKGRLYKQPLVIDSSI